jgi:hypothetical protein
LEYHCGAMNPYLPYAPPGTAPVPPQVASAGATPSGLSELALEMLRQTRPWVVFLGILSFVAAGFMVLGGLGMAIFGAIAAATSPSLASAAPQAAMGLIYLPLGFVYIYPGLKLVKYGGAIGRLMQSRSAADLEDALTQQKSLWKFSGIFAIVALVLYVVLIGGFFIFFAEAVKSFGR